MKHLFIASLLVGLTAPAYATTETSKPLKATYKGKGMSQMLFAEKRVSKPSSLKRKPYVKR